MDNELAQHFALRAATYDQAAWVRDPEVMSATLDFVTPHPGQHILDVGAGTAAVLEAILNACPQVAECAAVDISPEMLARIRHPRIRSYHADAQSLPFDDATFDVVICRQTLHYIDDLDRCLCEIHRVLKREGILVIGQMTPFGAEDEDHWKTIVHLRQPLRKHNLTQPELIGLVVRNGFQVGRTSHIAVRESLNAWLARYKDSDRQLMEVRRLHLNAPAAYRRIHRLECHGDDVFVDNCWMFIRALKTEARMEMSEDGYNG